MSSHKTSWLANNQKKALFLTICITFTLFLLTLELLFRLAVFLKSGPEIQRVQIVSAETYGWVLNTQMREVHRVNRCGEQVITKPPPHPLIIKYPKYNHPKKILFVGDSFTHAHEVSTGKAYYDVFEELVKDQYSVFAAGVGGYGNLQEYLIIKNLHSEIEPDIIFWQLSGNDPVNNVFELEASQLDNNNQRPRPYLDIEDNEIKMLDPGFWPLEHSRGFRYLFGQLLIVDWHYKLGILNSMNSPLALDPEIASEKIKLGLEITDRLLSLAMSEFPKTRFVGFSVDPNFEDDYKAIFLKNNADYLSDFYKAVDGVDHTNCQPLDAHWNHKGNRVAGEELFRRLDELQ